MKKNILLITMISTVIVISSTSVFCEEYYTEITNTTEQIIENISERTQEYTDTTMVNTKSGSQKAVESIKEHSKIVADKTVLHTKSGAHKVKHATINGANRFSNFTAKGIRKTAEKIQNSAEKTIERTDKALEEVESTSKCNCSCLECPCSK